MSFCTIFNVLFHRIEKYLEEVSENLNLALASIDSKLKSEGFKSRILQVFRAWEEGALYSKEKLYKLKGVFLGKPVSSLSFSRVLKITNLSVPREETRRTRGH